MRIMTWENKYGTIIYAADTDEQLEGAARYVLAQLLEDGYIYAPSEVRVSPEDAEVIAMSADDLAGLSASLRKAAETVRARHAARVAENDEEAGEYHEAHRILAGKAEWNRVHVKPEDADEDERWARMVAASAKWFGPVDVREDGIYRPETAWDILNRRDGAEYEHYSVDNVENHTITAW